MAKSLTITIVVLLYGEVPINISVLGHPKFKLHLKTGPSIYNLMLWLEKAINTL